MAKTPYGTFYRRGDRWVPAGEKLSFGDRVLVIVTVLIPLGTLIVTAIQVAKYW